MLQRDRCQLNAPTKYSYTNLHGKVVLNLFLGRFSGSLPTVHDTPGSSPYGIDYINAFTMNDKN